MANTMPQTIFEFDYCSVDHLDRAIYYNKQTQELLMDDDWAVYKFNDFTPIAYVLSQQLDFDTLLQECKRYDYLIYYPDEVVPQERNK